MNKDPILAAVAAAYSVIMEQLQACRAAGATVEGPFQDEFVITIPDDKREAVEAILAGTTTLTVRGEVRYA